MTPGAFKPRRELGKTGFHATVLGIGDIADRRIPLAELVKTARRAMDAGLNVIDTAPGYENGYSEEVVGRALRGRRDGMFVIDKIDFADQPVSPQVEGSLSRLGLDSVDLFVFHGVSMEQWRLLSGPGGGCARLDACLAAGKARFKGISAHTPDVLLEALKSGWCDVVMFPMGPYVHGDCVDRVLPLAKTLGVGTVCFKTFGAGKLLGDTTGYNQPLRRRPRGKTSSGGAPAAPRLTCLSVAECVGYTLTRDPDVALLGLSFPNEQDAAFKAALAFRPLPPARMTDIRRRAAEAVKGKGPCWWGVP